MDVEVLKAKAEEEQLNQESFTEIEFHYLEIASLLLAHAKDDIKQKSEIRRLVQDIFNLRNAKIRNGLKKLQATDRTLDLKNVSAVELQLVRKLLTSTFEVVSQLSKTAETN